MEVKSSTALAKDYTSQLARQSTTIYVRAERVKVKVREVGETTLYLLATGSMIKLLVGAQKVNEGIHETHDICGIIMINPSSSSSSTADSLLQE